MKMLSFFSRPLLITPQAIRVLLLGLPVLLTQLGYIAFDILYGINPHKLYTVALYQKGLENIMAEIAILVFGAFLFDVVVRDIDQNG